MRNTTDRVDAVFRKTQELREKRYRRCNAFLGSVSGFCGILLFCCIYLYTGESAGYAEKGSYTASALLFENAGGYVLVAVVAFFVAAAITILIFRWKNRK